MSGQNVGEHSQPCLCKSYKLETFSSFKTTLFCLFLPNVLLFPAFLPLCTPLKPPTKAMYSLVKESFKHTMVVRHSRHSIVGNRATIGAHRPSHNMTSFTAWMDGSIQYKYMHYTLSIFVLSVPIITTKISMSVFLFCDKETTNI